MAEGKSESTKHSRRTFLKLGAAAAAGTAVLGPLIALSRQVGGQRSEAAHEKPDLKTLGEKFWTADYSSLYDYCQMLLPNLKIEAEKKTRKLPEGVKRLSVTFSASNQEWNLDLTDDGVTASFMNYNKRPATIDSVEPEELLSKVTILANSDIKKIIVAESSFLVGQDIVKDKLIQASALPDEVRGDIKPTDQLYVRRDKTFIVEKSSLNFAVEKSFYDSFIFNKPEEYGFTVIREYKEGLFENKKKVTMEDTFSFNKGEGKKDRVFIYKGFYKDLIGIFNPSEKELVN